MAAAGDWGTVILVQIMDQQIDVDGRETLTPVDLTAEGITVVATITRPDGTVYENEVELDPSEVEGAPPSQGWAQYVVSEAKPLNQAGKKWLVRPRVTIAGSGSWRSLAAAHFPVTA